MDKNQEVDQSSHLMELVVKCTETFDKYEDAVLQMQDKVTTNTETTNENSKLYMEATDRYNIALKELGRTRELYRLGALEIGAMRRSIGQLYAMLYVLLASVSALVFAQFGGF